jgi:hypothetical protein
MGNSPETGEYLKELGYNTIHLLDEHMEKASDSEILDKALNEKRVRCHQLPIEYIRSQIYFKFCFFKNPFVLNKLF